MTSLNAGGIATSGGVRFLGQRRSYWRLLIRGAALLMVTLGIYRFWLVTDVRRFLWSNTEIAGERIEYTGTALELLLGFLVAVALLIPIYAGIFSGGTRSRSSREIVRRHGLCRAGCARPIRDLSRAPLPPHADHLPRAALSPASGSAWSYAVRATLWWIATVLTLGLAYPFQMRKPRALQDAKYVLRRFGRPV